MLWDCEPEGDFFAPRNTYMRVFQIIQLDPSGASFGSGECVVEMVADSMTAGFITYEPKGERSGCSF